ncbi:MAG: hypothetical protein AB7Q27_09720 [Acidimicrobiia bacterium]
MKHQFHRGSGRATNCRSPRTIAISVPVDEVHDGDNTIEFASSDDVVASNVDVILVAGSPVPS